MNLEFIIIGDWQGGFHAGSVKYVNNMYLYRVTINKQSIKTYFTTEEKAKNYQVAFSNENGLTKNQYRLVECDIDGNYIEIRLQDDNFIAKIDVEDLKLTYEYTWSAKPSEYRCYMSHSNRKESNSQTFHRILFPEWEQIDHINRDRLDNRKKNLRPVSSHENNMNQHKRKDNTSGKTGIHYSEYDETWIVQWPEDGERKKKSFSISKYGYDGAKLLALNHRQKMDLKNNILNGCDSDDEPIVKVTPINIDKVKIKKNLVSTNKSGKEGVYFLKTTNTWIAEYKDEENKKHRKSFRVKSDLTYAEAYKLAMAYEP